MPPTFLFRDRTLDSGECLAAGILTKPLLHSRLLSFPIIRVQTRNSELLVFDRVRKIACGGGSGGQRVDGESIFPIAQGAGSFCDRHRSPAVPDSGIL